MKFSGRSHRLRLVFAVFGALCLAGQIGSAQEQADQASVSTSIGKDGTAAIIVEARGQLPDPTVYYTARARANVIVGTQFVEQTIDIEAKVIQGDAETLSFGLNGNGQVVEVTGTDLQSWSVRRQDDQRFLDLNLKADVTDLKFEIKIRSDELELPRNISLTHVAPGEAIGFDSLLRIEYAGDMQGAITNASGFAPLASDASSTEGSRGDQFQTATGGELTLSLSRDGTSPASVELINTTLEGEMHSNGESISFRLRSTASVTEPNSEITILAGGAAVSEVPDNGDYRLRLMLVDDQPVYKLVFENPGTYPVTLDFVASLQQPGANWQRMDFTVAAGAVVPVALTGLDSDLEFQRDRESVVPVRDDDQWLGFLPADGRARLQWKPARKAGEGNLFFTSTAQVETRIGTGLLRQDHQIDCQVLQGELTSLTIQMRGPGEILDVQGSNIVGWEVTGEGDERQLKVTLSQPITGAGKIEIRSQTPLSAFPVRVEGMRLTPVGAIRHSGYLRLTNLGSVRLEPTELNGLTQLAPEQFPGDPTKARQTFVYRFPASDYAFTVAATRIQPEVSISELALYQLAETDRVITADIELDIREAAIREWDFGVPDDYSVVSVSGASVADYVTATESVDGVRNLKIVFAQDVGGRQLVKLHLEKNQVAAAEDWILPRIEYPGAKAVRGDIGIIGAPGFRIAVVETDLLVEKPLSYFPRATPNLQQAFRIREPGWSATVRIEMLDRSVQADVFHLYSLSQQTVYGSALINYFVTGAPVTEWNITVPESLGNVMVDGQDVRTWRREGDTLIVSLHQPVMGPYTLLVTFEEKPDESEGVFQAGQIAPSGVQGERGYIQVVSPMQVETSTVSVSADMLELDPLELPAEFRLLSTAPALGTWQYTDRPFTLTLGVNWFQPGTTVAQVVEFSEANSRVSQDGELVTDVLYYVKSRGLRSLRIKLPGDPVRLWEVSVNGRPVTARQAEEATLIPLPGGTDPNVPMEVRLRLGKPTVSESRPELMLPIVYAPVLKTLWNVSGDEQRVLVPNRGTVEPPIPVLRPTGFEWVARRGILVLILIGLLTLVGIWSRSQSGVCYALGLPALVIAVAVAAAAAFSAVAQREPLAPLQLSLPILSSGELVEMQVKNVPLWRVNLSWLGLTTCLVGTILIIWSFVRETPWPEFLVRWGGVLLIALGVLLQRDGAPWFYGLLAVMTTVLLLLPQAAEWIRAIVGWARRRAERRSQGKKVTPDAGTPESGAVTASTLLLALTASSLFVQSSLAEGPSKDSVANGFEAADSIRQQWKVTHRDSRLDASGTISVSGRPGDRFLLLRAPAVLTRFEGEGLRLTKKEVPDHGLCYIVSIPRRAENDLASDDPDQDDAVVDSATSDSGLKNARAFEAAFEYQLEAFKPMEEMPVLTGTAAVQEIDFSYDEAGWDIVSPTAVRIAAMESGDSSTRVNVLLGPGSASLMLQPKARDVTTEETQIFVEASNLYLPGPGVVDGRHRIRVRPSRGQVSALNVVVPEGLTVSAVKGPVGSWQFDAESGKLKLEIEPTQTQAFDVLIDTQRGLEPLPADVSLAPLRVSDASGEVGLIAIAFGPDAQPEKSEATGMSAVNAGDFDASLISSDQAVLHRVYRYGAEGGELALRVAPVDAEVRVVSRQVLSLGDERVVLGINFAADITRAGLFQLSFPLPEGLEVESLSGDSLHHWSELSEGDQRQITLHLNGKTIGTQSFALTLSGPAPTDVGDWSIPRFELNESTRQTGELVVRPTTGIRLRTVSRQNVSETDPRNLGGKAEGALAFRLLQRDWSLVLGIEKLDAWVTGQVLHEIILREGQTRTTVFANFVVQNASIRTLRVRLPITDNDEIKTLRATGSTVSDFVRTSPDSDIWEVQFKRRVVGRIQFRLEYERRGDRENESESIVPIEFPDARQLAYYFSVRAGGRLEIEHGELSDGWQRVDWNSVPQTLREAGNRFAPALTLRAVGRVEPLPILVTRHSLADALKLRVASGSLTTVLSPTGDQLTAVDLSMEVIQRSSLSVRLPDDGELFSIFVNGESVHSIRQTGNANAWQFYILPGIDDRTAQVRFVYTVTGDRLSRLQLSSPQLNVPLENIKWNVVAPKGFELTDDDGNLELVGQENQKQYDRQSYLSKTSGKREVQARRAAALLQQANQLLQAGEQTKARWALNSVANQYALDAASNEDARVQLENLQTQQAIVGLNTRRQRLYLDNSGDDTALTDNEQIRQAAADNPILQQDQLNFRPQQLSQLLRGNTTEDNAVLQQIAGRLVQHQRTTEPAPQAIIISLPEEGSVYSFSRSVQVAENSPLDLDLEFRPQLRLHFWQSLALMALLVAFAALFAIVIGRRDATV